MCSAYKIFSTSLLYAAQKCRRCSKDKKLENICVTTTVVQLSKTNKHISGCLTVFTTNFFKNLTVISNF